MRYDFSSGATTQTVSLAENSEVFSNCGSLSIFRVVCGESFSIGNFPTGSPITLGAGDYEITVQSTCKDCWMCVLPLVADGPSADGPNDPTAVDPEIITYCNTDTGTQFIKTVVFTIAGDGTVSESVMSDDDTGFLCGTALPTYDIEKIGYCNTDTGTTWTKICRYVTTDGVTTEELISETDTGKPCIEEGCSEPTAIGVITDMSLLDTP